MPQQRLILAMVGALAGGSLYLVFRAAEEGFLGPRLALAAMVAAGVFFTALLALTGPMALIRAAGQAAVLALVVGGLTFWASFRFASANDLLGSPLAVAAVLVLSFVPLPFILAGEATRWRDYPALFSAPA